MAATVVGEQPVEPGNAPEMSISSTDDGAKGPIARIANMGASAAEATIHTTQSSFHERNLDQQYVVSDTFDWTVGQGIGTVIWRRPIHPQHTNMYVEYFSRAYNTWGGGFDYRVTIAGTGFHAGKLMLIKLPPNMDPGKMVNLNKMTIFPHKILDAKQLEVEFAYGTDQRYANFHWMEFDPEKPASFGGWMALVVMIPLNTSASGEQRIGVQVAVKCSPRFTMDQLRPVDQIPQTGSNTAEYVQESLNITDSMRDENYGFRFGKLHIGGGKEWMQYAPIYINPLDTWYLNPRIVDRDGFAIFPEGDTYYRFDDAYSELTAFSATGSTKCVARGWVNSSRFWGGWHPSSGLTKKVRCYNITKAKLFDATLVHAYTNMEYDTSLGYYTPHCELELKLDNHADAEGTDQIAMYGSLSDDWNAQPRWKNLPSSIQQATYTETSFLYVGLVPPSVAGTFEDDRLMWQTTWSGLEQAKRQHHFAWVRGKDPIFRGVVGVPKGQGQPGYNFLDIGPFRLNPTGVFTTTGDGAGIAIKGGYRVKFDFLQYLDHDTPMDFLFGKAAAMNRKYLTMLSSGSGHAALADSFSCMSLEGDSGKQLHEL